LRKGGGRLTWNPGCRRGSVHPGVRAALLGDSRGDAPLFERRRARALRNMTCGPSRCGARCSSRSAERRSRCRRGLGLMKSRDTRATRPPAKPGVAGSSLAGPVCRTSQTAAIVAVFCPRVPCARDPSESIGSRREEPAGEPSRCARAVALWPVLPIDMCLLPRRKVRPQESPASEVGDWLDDKIAALLREVDQSGKTPIRHSERESAPRASRPAGEIRAGRWDHRRGGGRAASRMLSGAARSSRARGAAPIAWYGLAIALSLLMGWLVVVLGSRY
jgi:hypothetical protein